MPRSPSIVKRFPGKHVGQIKIWYPDPEKPGEYRTRWEAEGSLTKASADLIFTLAALQSHVSPELEKRLAELAEEIPKLPALPPGARP